MYGQSVTRSLGTPHRPLTAALTQPLCVCDLKQAEASILTLVVDTGQQLSPIDLVTSAVGHILSLRTADCHTTRLRLSPAAFLGSVTHPTRCVAHHRCLLQALPCTVSCFTTPIPSSFTMLSRAASRIVYVQPSGIASFSLSSLSRSSRFAPSSLSSQLRVSSRRGVTTTAATPPPPRPPVSTPATASTTAAAAAESASNAGGSSGSGAGKQSFFKSDSWTKTVGTVGALANWSIPIAAITHMLSTKDPATTIDPVMTTCQQHSHTHSRGMTLARLVDR